MFHTVKRKNFRDTPQPTATPTPGEQPFVAPNPSYGGPIQILIPLDSSANVKVTVYDLLGNRLWGTRFRGEAGSNTVVWDAVNRAGEAVAAGMYIVSIDVQIGSDHKIYTLRLALIR